MTNPEASDPNVWIHIAQKQMSGEPLSPDEQALVDQAARDREQYIKEDQKRIQHEQQNADTPPERTKPTKAMERDAWRHQRLHEFRTDEYKDDEKE